MIKVTWDLKVLQNVVCRSKIFTLFLESAICSTRVGPSVVMLIDKNPEPGLSFFLQIACSIGIPSEVLSCVTDIEGPNTTSFPRNNSIFNTYYNEL